ncbi:DUF1972 domain-containing protein [Paenibacillus sp. PDC88]|uniref:DUF1972 domain-containing protein n=1 Tax=Paenibacillus sp. PDC88 TaxID=1884375 RepID=UPI000898D8DB|nr:DUF1972 domain-containing protein [Paenibacillus sp. PDC88]SDX31442.1 Glycosyltransferase involved in cell wall bisynthesis [Paenibacillus sp. PDC88]
MKKKIGYCGTRGLPANYGGFETAVEKITENLNSQDIENIIFCRSNEPFKQSVTYGNSKLLYIKGSKSRILDTFITSFRTGKYILSHRNEFDFVFWFNNANLPGILMTRLSGIPMAVNTDGLEWRRAKWSLPFKLYYFLSSFLISIMCKNLISDSEAIQNYYKSVFKKNTIFIPYGAPKQLEVSTSVSREVLKKYDLITDKYFIQITRFEPDNLPLEIIKGFQKSELYKKGYKFVLVGYKGGTDYSEKIMNYHNNAGVIILPANYDQEELAVLRSEAFAYVHGNSVGGTNPALLEAMAYCKRIIAIDGPFSSEVLGSAGMLFNRDRIDEAFLNSLNTPNQLSITRMRLNERYSWSAVSEAYFNVANSTFTQYLDYLGQESNVQSSAIIKTREIAIND